MGPTRDRATQARGSTGTSSAARAASKRARATRARTQLPLRTRAAQLAGAAPDAPDRGTLGQETTPAYTAERLVAALRVDAPDRRRLERARRSVRGLLEQRQRHQQRGARAARRSRARRLPERPALRRAPFHGQQRARSAGRQQDRLLGRALWLPALGSDEGFVSILLDARGYQPIAERARGPLPDRLDRAVRQHSADAVPLPERFYLGGSSSVRGFHYWGLGPRERRRQGGRRHQPARRQSRAALPDPAVARRCRVRRCRQRRSRAASLRHRRHHLFGRRRRFATARRSGRCDSTSPTRSIRRAAPTRRSSTSRSGRRSDGRGAAHRRCRLARAGRAACGHARARAPACSSTRSRAAGSASA